MRTVFTTTDPVQASLMQVALRDAGLEFEVDNENSAWMALGMPTPATPIVFQVHEKDFDAASDAIRETLARLRESRKPDPGQKQKP